MKCRSCFALTIAVLVNLAGPTEACSSPRPVPLQNILSADLIIFGSYVSSSFKTIPSAIDADRIEKVWTVRFEVARTLLGENQPVVDFHLVDNYGFSGDRFRVGSTYIVALRDTSNGAFTTQLGAIDDPLPVVMANNCGNYVFGEEGQRGLMQGFVMEMFDGDGDPADEAAVFDRFLRGSGLY